MRLPKGGAAAVERSDAGRVLYVGATARGRALRSMPQARLESRIVCQHNKEPHPFNVGCGRSLESLKRQIRGRVDNVNTFGFGLGRRSAGLGRIRYVFWSSLCLQGLECGSSPTSGTVDPLVRGVFPLPCVQSLWWRPPDASGAGCGLAAAVAYSGVWVAGSVPLAGGPSACSVVGLCGSSFRCCRVGRACPTPVHGPELWVLHDL